ncbi:MAG: metal-dependent hydrolase [Verrucomicrobiota bacterium]
MNRRLFLTQAAAVSAAPLLAAAEKSSALIDCNLHLGPHPTRALPEIDEAFLTKRDISEAWAGSFEALLHRDIGAVNERLVKRCAASSRLHPVGSVNPRLPAWQSDLRICAEKHRMPMIRLYPNHHGYTLADDVFLRLLDEATKLKLCVQIVAQLEDQRSQSPLMQVPPVDLKPLAEAMKQVPDARVMVLNANASMITTALRGCTKVWVDIAMIEGVGGVENLLSTWPADKVCFGSHAPFFYWESASLKMQESVLKVDELSGIRSGNARSLLAAAS